MITNNYNLPQKIVDLVTDDNYTYTPHRYSATEILNSTKEIILKRRHKDKIIVDVSDYVNMLFGIAFHTLMETGEDNEEQRLEHKLKNGATLSGRIDKIIASKIKDYKTTTVWKVKSNDFTDWEKQGLIYAWLCRKNNIYIDEVEFIAFIKDYSMSRKGYEPNYPESQIFIYNFKITTDKLLVIDKFINDKLNELELHIDTPDNLLPQPSDEELWKTPDTWAVFKNGGKRAVKVCDNVNEANDLIKSGKGDYIEFREGEYTKLEYSSELRQLWRIAGDAL